jgi:curved DNA-binding protein CbpA
MALDGSPDSTIAARKERPLHLKANLIPKPVHGLDVRRLPLGPVEGFVLSRVDGRTTDSEIALLTGMPQADVVIVLHRLAELGAVQYEGSGDAPRQATEIRATDASQANASGLHRRAPPVITEASPDAKGRSWPELAEQVELDVDRKKLILETFDGLEKVDHYRILKVPQDADKKAIKSAYFQIVANFHPDRYFGKKLGSYKQKLEAIFKRITEAHDTLTRKETRADYDRYLENQRATQALDEIVDEEAHSRQLDEIQREIEREASRDEGPARSITPRPSLSPEERRRALARKFSSPNIAQQRREGPAPTSPEAQEAAKQLLTERYEAKVAEVRTERIRRYVEQADKALEAKNVLGAANALRLALSLSPDDKALADRFAIVERDAAATFAERYVEQAKYDEQRNHFVEAAKSYERALKGRPTAQIYERTAHCLVEARSELKKAVELARKAVELAPQTTPYRITLARAFARAGKAQSALGELERARTQDPANETVKEWINRVKRGEV